MNKLTIYFGHSRTVPVVGDQSRIWFDKFIGKGPAVLYTYSEIKSYLLIKLGVGGFSSGMKMMLDSGAYSIWKSGTEVDLDSYIAFCKKELTESQWGELYFVGLDKIPGTISTAPTGDELKNASNTSYLNYVRMKEAGVVNIPVYHFGEDLGVLDRYLEIGVDYIGIGGMARAVSDKNKRLWLDSLFTHIEDTGISVNLHGFGITSSSLVKGYPWYSVDSVSVALAVGHGSVFIFNTELKKLSTVYVAGIMSTKKVSPAILEYLSVKYSIKVSDLNDWWCRCYISFLAWLEFEDYINNSRDSGTSERIVRQNTLF